MYSQASSRYPFPKPASMLLFLKFCIDTVLTKGKCYKTQAQSQHVTLHNKNVTGKWYNAMQIISWPK